MHPIKHAISETIHWFSPERRARRRVKMLPRGDLYLARDRDFEWFIPDPDPGHFLWTKLFIGKKLRFEDDNLIREGDTVIDIGACTGEWTLYASRQAGPSGRVIAFEPDPDHFPCLEQNMALHRCDNVECVQMAISDKPGTLQLHRLDGTLAGGSLDTGYLEKHRAVITDSPSVKVTPLDDYFGANIPAIAAISVTVNEFEPEALRGATRALAKTRHVISQSPRHAEVKDILTPLGFRVVSEIPQNVPGEFIALFSRA